MVKGLDIKVWRDLIILKAQSFTIAILVIAGVSLLVASWSAYRSLQNARDQYYRDYALANIFSSVKRAPRHIILQLQKISGVQTVESRLVYEGLLDIKGQSEPAVARLISIPDSGSAHLNKIYLRRGRLPQLSSEVEVVVHEGFAKAHDLKPGDHLSAVVQGQKKTLLVAGIGLSPEYVYAISAIAPLPDDRHFGVFWINQTNLEQLTGMSSSFNDVSFLATEGISHEAIKSEVDRILKPYGSLGAYSRDNLASAVFVDDEIRQQKISAIFSPTVFLSIAAFLIHVIATRLIAMQRIQIATLKAIGYTNNEISFHYVKMIFLMIAMGILPGIAIGAWLGGVYAKMYENFFHFPYLNFSLNIESTAVGVLAGLVPGLLGTFGSIRETFRMVPAEAMRPPSPPIFHKSILEKFKITSGFSIRGKMIWRNLFFKPWRLLLIVTGMSASLSVVILSGFWMDTLDTMLKVQFQQIQKEDVSLNLLTPKSSNVLQQLKQLNGVTQVEGYRTIPVRIKYLNYKKETLMMGYPPKTQLRQPVDSNLNPISLPEHGFLLSNYFKKNWGVKTGDLITLETLEGSQKIREVKVTGFTDDLIGQAVTAPINELWKIMGEDPSYNMLALKIDPSYSQSLYIKFKNFPNIAIVNFKTIMYRGFQENFGDMMRTSTNILIIFALIIAISIIYNSIRVSFSERSWEIASLRVLGFEKADVLGLLLLEVSAQMLLSVIPGCALGLFLSYLSSKMVTTEYFSFPLIINLKTYGLAIIVQYLALIGSLIIIWSMIKKLNMVEALKARD